MEKREITISSPVLLAGMKLIAITETTVACSTSSGSFMLHWKKRPLAIVIQAPDTMKAFSIDGNAIALEELRDQFPEIEFHE